MTSEALTGEELVRNWTGRSLCVYRDGVSGWWCHEMWGKRTSSTLPLPLSLMLRANESSRPVAGSVRVRKAWCGRLGFLPSTVVRTIFKVSWAPRTTGFSSGDLGLNL